MFRRALFSDAVFAIAITSLILETRVPNLGAEARGRELLVGVPQLLPKWIGFFVCFMVVGAACGSATIGSSVTLNGMTTDRSGGASCSC